jgi:hypothetical protein
MTRAARRGSQEGERCRAACAVHVTGMLSQFPTVLRCHERASLSDCALVQLPLLMEQSVQTGYAETCASGPFLGGHRGALVATTMVQWTRGVVSDNVTMCRLGVSRFRRTDELLCVTSLSSGRGHLRSRPCMVKRVGRDVSSDVVARVQGRQCASRIEFTGLPCECVTTCGPAKCGC